MENNTATATEAKKQAYRLTNQFLKEGKKLDQLLPLLLTSGVDNVTATMVMNEAMQQVKTANMEKGKRDMTYGVVLFGIGITVTVVTYSMASSSETGGAYFLMYGPVIFGIIRFFRGLNMYNSSK